mmetsp:Transcript_10006/g.28439  ORF Transcript_10006/g.28439 Transcript_10006/m.28439 type:complete len:245 (+) Transcript_10006:279-1013(+)
MLQDLDQRDSVGGIQPGGRFVQQQARRVGQELGADVDALLFAAAEHSDGRVLDLAEAQESDDVVDLFQLLLPCPALREAQEGRVGQLVADREIREEDVVLPHVRDLRDEALHGAVGGRHGAAVDGDDAAVEREAAAEGVEQGRLAAAGRPQQREDLAGRREGGDLVEDDLLGGTGGGAASAASTSGQRRAGVVLDGPRDGAPHEPHLVFLHRHGLLEPAPAQDDGGIGRGCAFGSAIAAVPCRS